MPFNMPLSHGLLLLATSLVHAVGTGAQQAYMGPPSVEPVSTIAGDNAMLLDFMNAVAGQAGAGDGKTINVLGSKLDAANPLYSGIPTFMHLRTLDCASSDGDGEFDIGVVGMPFDLGVTYRPGARFGPGAARMASRRIRAGKTYE
ncbi:hypothetical protein KEM55_009085 [Ascosphaera atra]|nr:hypothetical protein KEM55_009085 [Ascosphaera atra]